MKDSITIYSPGNIVSITISSDMKIKDIEIQDDIFTIEQKPLLEEMISSTINQAYEQMSAKQKSLSNDEVEQTTTNNNNDNPYSMDNIKKMKQILEGGNFQESIGNIMKDFKIDYKDGKPYCSVPMDMLGNEGFSSIIDMFSGNSNDKDDKDKNN